MGRFYQMKKKTSRGFTLIELMIAISILSLLLFTASYSYSLISSRWNKELGKFSYTAKEIKHLQHMQQLLEGIHSFIVVDKESKPFFFFIGHSQSLLAVSQSGLFSGKYPEIFKLSTIERENKTVDLVYQSVSTEHVMLKTVEQEIEFTNTLVLFEGLERIDIQYYGWNSFEEKAESSGGSNSEFWQKSYSGIDKRHMPTKISFSLISDGSSIVIPISLQHDVEKWLSPFIDKDT